MDRGWDEADARTAARALRPFARALEIAEFDYNPIGPRGVAALTDALRGADQLEELHLRLRDEPPAS